MNFGNNSLLYQWLSESFRACNSHLRGYLWETRARPLSRNRRGFELGADKWSTSASESDQQQSGENATCQMAGAEKLWLRITCNAEEVCNAYTAEWNENIENPQSQAGRARSMAPLPTCGRHRCRSGGCGRPAACLRGVHEEDCTFDSLYRSPSQ